MGTRLGRIGEIEEVRRSGGELCVDWRIPRFLRCQDGDSFESPPFNFFDARWHLEVCPNWDSSGEVLLFLQREVDAGPSTRTLIISVGVRGSGGAVEWRRVEEEWKFGEGGCWPLFDFCRRSELREQGERLMPGGELTIAWEVKVPGSAVRGALPWPDVRIRTDTQTGQSNAHACKSQSLDKQDSSTQTDSDLEVEVPIEVKLSSAKREKEELTVEIKNLREQIEDYERSHDLYCSEISSYESKVAELENKLSLSDERYQEHVQSTITASSELRKACMEFELLKKEICSLMEQIKTLKRTVEYYELKSENYNKQISTLDSELISSAEQYKCQNKLTIAYGLGKAALHDDDDDAEEENYGNNDRENDEESKNKKNWNQMRQVKNTKKISLPARHGGVILSLKAILAGGRWADFTLKSGSGEWRVHRAILGARSGRFETLFRGEWAQRDEVGVDDVPEAALDAVLRFVYAGEVGEMSAEIVCGMYEAAHSFHLEDLKSLCLEYMEERMCPEMVCGALVVAETHDKGDLKERAKEFLQGIRHNCRHGRMEGVEGESPSNYR